MRTSIACTPKRVRTIWLLIFGLVLTIGCAVETPSQPKVIPPATGSPMTPEWREYNRQAEAKGAPLLKYVVTAKERTRTRPREFRGIQDTFSTEDDRVYFRYKWTNVKGRPIEKIRIYDPRGILFREYESSYRGRTGKWSVTVVLYIKGWAAARLPGKWRAEIYMEDVLATTKEFVIGSATHRYERQTSKRPGLTVGVYPYFIDAPTSQTSRTKWMPLYIAQMLTVDFENYRVVMPFELWKHIARPVVKYEDLSGFLNQELRSEGSEWNEMIKKHQLDLVITGKVLDSGEYGEEKEATFYIINAKTKHIKEIKTSFTSSRAFDRGQVRDNFYKDVYDQLLKKGADEFRIAAPAPTPKSVVSDPKEVTLENRLQKLKELRQKNLITNEEYERAKKDVLKKLTE